MRGINVSEMASSKEMYFNLRSELAFLAREWLETKNHGLPRCPGGCARECQHERLAYELTIPRYTFTSLGKRRVEPKDAIKKRLHRSCNLFDAFALSFASEHASLLAGGKQGWGSSWSEPLKRDLNYV